MTSPIVRASTSATRSSRSRVHSDRGHVRARGRGALLALVLERAAHERGAQRRRRRRTGGRTRSPCRRSRRRGAGRCGSRRCSPRPGPTGAGTWPCEPVKWMPASAGSASSTSETSWPSPVSRLITPGRHARLLEQPHRQVRGEALRRRRLPDHRVAHQRGRGGQVAGDRGEVERRDRVDEALERAVVHAVPHARRAAAAGSRGSARAKATLKRQKSASSHAASISAW